MIGESGIGELTQMAHFSRTTNSSNRRNSFNEINFSFLFRKYVCRQRERRLVTKPLGISLRERRNALISGASAVALISEFVSRCA